MGRRLVVLGRYHPGLVIFVLKVMAILCYAYYFWYFWPVKREEYHPLTYGLREKVQNIKLHHQSCDAQYATPLAPELEDAIDKEQKSKKECIPKEKVRSTLKNGLLSMKNVGNGEVCKFRAVPYDIQGSPRGSEVWYEFGVQGKKPESDFVQVMCHDRDKITYQFLHHQIYRKLPESRLKIENPPPDIHIIVTDSVAMPQMRAALPKTMKLLVDQFSAELFLFHNRVEGETAGQSRVLLMQNRITNMTSHPLGQNYSTIDEIRFNVCNAEEFAFNIARGKGYRTLFGLDWTTYLMWGCQEGDRFPVDHFMDAYWEQLNKIFPDAEHNPEYGPVGRMFYRSNLWGRFCLERHKEMLDYLFDFMEAYKNEPQLTVTWLAYLTHDYRGDLYKYDEDFVEFFQRLRAKAPHSHIFLMGDHGNRLYSDKTLAFDRIEENNPALIYLPPEAVKNDEVVMKRIRKNTRQLVSTFDIYATVVDILQNKNDLTSAQAPEPPIKLVGASLFRELPQPRNCESLQLGFHLCLCPQLGPEIRFHPLAEKLAEFVVQYANGYIAASEDSDLCSPLVVDPDFATVVEEYTGKGSEEGEKSYKVTVRTFPGKAVFDPWIAVFPNGTMQLLTIPYRKNAFAFQAKCIHDRYNTARFTEHFCFCRNLLNVTSEVEKVNN
ncbi:unnamed protein product [Bursaphelenchus xylophilus]|uniref:(pine wood nematode) hypothetical protein n=1 Tax=Bursaphelenchus xylophilus TaxID=6326 RepID=A0A1I7RXW8_BURXY|nr:unnamed protein product [Bursaphelenchus xylophilus]CAG9125217.1 unnamed protein product [Bursaphelenchus xylophilus]